jgi:nucleotide-binding universal stress UspA family protein
VIRAVLVALDESVRAPGVFRAAVEVASRFSATVYPMRAIAVPVEFERADGLLYEHLSRVATQDIERLMTAGFAIRIAPPIVRVGEPSGVILQVSEELDVDLVVLGSHGYRALDGVLGTTAGRVANQSTRNVLVVHEDLSGAVERLLVRAGEAAN